MDNEIIQKIISAFEIRIGLNPENMTFHGWKAALQQRMKVLGISNLSVYYSKMMMSEGEFKELMELVLVPETWFFRDKGSFDFVNYYVTHTWLKSPGRLDRLRVLSMPCSTGEEPLSIAILLHKMGLPSDLYAIDAWDVSFKNIQKAKTGVYGARSFRDKESLSLYKGYFDQSNSHYHIKDFVLEKVAFAVQNALTMKTDLKYDIVLCRNLLIYLSTSSQKIVIGKLKELLSHEGILLVSPVETQLIRNAGLVSVPTKNICAFKKDSSFVDVKNQTSSDLLFSHLPKQQNMHLSKKIFEEAVDLADKEQFEEAKKACKEFLEQEGPHSEGYFLMGVLQHATNSLEQAEASFRKTLYLAPDHYDALIYLALLFEKKGAIEEAQLFRNRAMRALNTPKADLSDKL